MRSLPTYGPVYPPPLPYFEAEVLRAVRTPHAVPIADRVPSGWTPWMSVSRISAAVAPYFLSIPSNGEIRAAADWLVARGFLDVDSRGEFWRAIVPGEDRPHG